MGSNSLQSNYPEIAKQWDNSKNNGVLPEDVAPKTAAKFWWKCDQGHQWEAAVSNRTRRGDGCPFCSGRYPVQGVNDFQTTYPALAKEWDFAKNDGLLPHEFTNKSGKSVWWRCENHHSYKAAISTRASGSGCGECYRISRSPNYNKSISEVSPQLESEYNKVKNLVPNADKVSFFSKEVIHWVCGSGHEFSSLPAERIRKGEIVKCPVCSNRTVVAGYNSLADSRSEILQEFDHEKNFPLTPYQITESSSTKIWWICPAGHSYRAQCRSRMSGTGCRYCANQEVLTGFNDMATTHPDLAKDFDLTKNGGLKPEDLIAGTRKTLWWICTNGHSFKSPGYVRITGSGCPVCANKSVVRGYNDFATTHPELAKEFDLEKNNGVTPFDFTSGTSRMFWWICSEGHSYKTTSSHRTGQLAGCPYCAKKKVLAGFNDMATLEPKLIEHFHPTKNHPKTPQNISPRTNVHLWWLCDSGHEYRAKPGNRLQENGMGCPVCSSHQVLKGFNDIPTTRPDLAAEWHPTKNGSNKPDQFTAGSNKKAWWICSEGHSWFAYIGLRSRGRGCPKCAFRGFDNTKPGWLYLIENSSLRARKIGISNFETKRIENYEATWSVIATWQSESGLLIRNLETEMLKVIRFEAGLPRYLSQVDMGRAGGASETFSIEGITNDEIIRKVWEKYLDLKEEGETLNLGIKNELGPRT